MTIFIGQNDTEPAAEDTLERGGSAVDLSSASTVAFHMEDTDGSVVVNEAGNSLAGPAGERLLFQTLVPMLIEDMGAKVLLTGTPRGIGTPKKCLS